MNSVQDVDRIEPLKHKNFKAVQKHLQPEIDEMVQFLLERANSGTAFPGLPKLEKRNIRAVVVDHRRGMAYTRFNSMSVPLWSYQRGREHFMYYTAHELSHLYSNSGGHGELFHKTFKRICPMNLWKFERRGFPGAWKQFGETSVAMIIKNKEKKNGK